MQATESLLPLLGVPQEDTRLCNCDICAEDLGQSYAVSLVIDSISVSPYEPMLVDSVDFLGAPTVLPHPLPWDSPSSSA